MKKILSIFLAIVLILSIFIVIGITNGEKVSKYTSTIGDSTIITERTVSRDGVIKEIRYYSYNYPKKDR